MRDANNPTPYRTQRWKLLRPLILRRDGYVCQLRLPRCKGHATHVDHIVDWADGGPAFDPTNLRAACNSCNVAQRNQRVAARARAMRQTHNSRHW